MTTYTNISKPVNTAYTNINSVGKEQYDQVSLSYDNSSTFYDGINDGLYTKVSKPITANISWLTATVTWASFTFSWGGGYTKIAKPI